MSSRAYLYIMCLAVLLFMGCSDEELALDGDSVENATADFQWTRAEDVETHSKFLRNFGLGYSYDAVRGSYCDWHDIRSQVINRYFVEFIQRVTGDGLIHTSTARRSEINQTFEYSFRDYVANVHLDLKEEMDLGLYEKTKRRRQNFIEDGVEESYYFLLEEKQMLVERYLSYASIMERYREQPDILTLSFRNAVEHLKETNEEDLAAVDSFINVWGTHVIVSAQIGGSLNIDLMNYMWRWSDQAKIDEWTTEEFLMKKKERQTHSNNDEYQWLEHARLYITAKGGDQNTLTGLLGEYKPDGSRTFSTDGISAWRNSLYYDPNDESASNVELIGMRVVPIWEFAEAVSHRQALRIKAAIQQDAAMQQELLGNWNFFDTSFPISYQTATCQYRNTSGKWQRYERTDADAMVVNIESGGRYVATVCHEQVVGHDLWVCYPIYEGKVNLACGVGVDSNQLAYDVKWVGGKCKVTPRSDVAGDCFYITNGAVRVKSTEGVTYAESHALPAVAIAGGVKPDGGYSSTVYPVMKDGSRFIFNTRGLLDDVVGWRLSDEFVGAVIAPNTIVTYMHKDNYTYIYNPNEMKYE